MSIKSVHPLLVNSSNLHPLYLKTLAYLSSQNYTFFDLDVNAIREKSSLIVQALKDLKLQDKPVIIGLSGGVDSALTALLFARAGYRVECFTLPIDTNEQETNRAVEFYNKHLSAYNTNLYNVDLSLTAKDIQNTFTNHIGWIAKSLMVPSSSDSEQSINIRRGNIKARTRMMFLFHVAHLTGGFVASTDNLSEYIAGFWTLHGDVGNIAPIQSLNKSYEVPQMALCMGIDEEFALATPTDGLGISTSDEDQLGFTYLEMDILYNYLVDFYYFKPPEFRRTAPLNSELIDLPVSQAILKRIEATSFKRNDPMNLNVISGETWWNDKTVSKTPTPLSVAPQFADLINYRNLISPT
jgi:nicotinamide-nucleotide amidase